MPNKKILITVFLSLMFIIPSLSIAAEPVTTPTDRELYPPANAGDYVLEVKKSYRTCFNDNDASVEILNNITDDDKPFCNHFEYSCLGPSLRVDCTETPQGFAWKCINYEYDYVRVGGFLGLWSGAKRPITAANSVSCSIPKKKLNAKCSTERNKCNPGMVDNIASSTEAYMWTCFGEGGGSNEQCEEKIPQIVDGKCGKTHDKCLKGISASPGNNGKEWVWKCLGENKGKDASCSEVIPFKGECGSKYFTCAAGTSTRQVTYTEKHLWACQGVGIGSLISCSQDRVQAGVCSTSVANKCDEGYPADTKNTATANTWTCTGVGGAASVSCSKNFSAQDGVCSSAHYRCAKGDGTSQLATTNVWSWICPGLFGGKSASCFESMGVKKGTCSSIKNQCGVGTPTGMTEDSVGYKWTCIGPNSGGNVSCETKKKTEGVCGEDKDGCISGEFATKTESRTMFNWRCNGLAGGGSESCSFPKTSTSSVTAICSKEHYACTAGRTTKKAESKTTWTWVCDGNTGGTNANCSEDKKVITPPNSTSTPNTSTSTPKEPNVCSLTDVACILKQCKGNLVCEDTVKKCVIGEVNCVENFVIVPGSKLPAKPGSCALNDLACLTKQCNSNSVCEDTIKKCSAGNATCVKNLVIEKRIQSEIVNKVCTMTDTACILKQCKGNLICEDTVKKCVKGEVNCVENFVIVPGSKHPAKPGSCALNDAVCLAKQCNDDLVCEDTIKKCSAGNATCIKDLVIDKGTQIKGKNDACAVDDIDCLIKKCNGNLTCINSLKKCRANDITCIDDSLIKVGTSITGPVTQSSLTCSPKDLQCLLRQCNGNLACESALKKCKLTDTKCVSAALLKRNSGWGPLFKENNGACSKDIFACTYGTNYDNVRDADSYKWSCVGKNGGYDSVCIVQNPKDAICSNKVHNTCQVGKPSKITETSTSWSWTCNGIGTGKSATCSMNIVPLDGVCSEKIESCEVGKVSLFRLNGDWNEWVCSGSYGGKNTDCFKEVKGSCSLSRYSCDSGIADSKSETEAGYGWKCRGANGDLTVSCFEKKIISNQAQSTSTATSTVSVSGKTNLNKALSSAVSFMNSKIKLFEKTVDNLFAII